MDAKILTWIALIIGSVYGNPPKLDLTKTTSVRQVEHMGSVMEGMPFEFKCAATGSQPITYVWTKNDKVVESSEDQRVKVDGGTLKISSLSHTLDDGKYQCTAKNKEGMDRSAVLHLEVTVVGQFLPSCQESSPVNVTDATIGKPLELSCPATTYFYPKIYDWGYKRFGPAESIVLDSRKVILTSGSLYFSYIEEKDIQEINDKNGIRCIIHSGGQEVYSCPITLKKIEGKPENFGPNLLSKLENTTGLEGGRVDLKCVASGRPTPTLKWFKGDQELKEKPYILSDGNVNLQINPLSKANEGEYKCVASSSYDGSAKEVDTSAFIKVDAKPSWKIELQDVTKTEGASLTAVCSAAGDPLPMYEWFKSGLKLISGENIKINDGSLIIKVLSLNDSGIYQCAAKNKYDTIYNSMTLTVQKVTTPLPTTTETTTLSTLAKTSPDTTVSSTEKTTKFTTVQSTSQTTQESNPAAKGNKVTDGSDRNSGNSVYVQISVFFFSLFTATWKQLNY